MRLSEAAVIERLAAGPSGAPAPVRDDVKMGIGDDGAVLVPPTGTDLVTVIDTLVEHVHFPPSTHPADLGYRSLAVNLSDLAAMGAEPAWASLSLALPEPGADWVNAFARGFFELAGAHGVALVGGDTVRGPLSVTVHATGFVPAGGALTRSGASAGDEVFVSGTPGDAAAGLAGLTGAREMRPDRREPLARRFHRPTPRLDLGMELGRIATAAIDVSDGLATDAGRLAAASGVAIELNVDALPLSPALTAAAGLDEARHYALSGGDDYELLFTLAPGRAAELERLAAGLGCRVTRIGRATDGVGVVCRLGGEPFAVQPGFDHFRAED